MLSDKIIIMLSAYVDNDKLSLCQICAIVNCKRHVSDWLFNYGISWANAVSDCLYKGCKIIAWFVISRSRVRVPSPAPYKTSPYEKSKGFFIVRGYAGVTLRSKSPGSLSSSDISASPVIGCTPSKPCTGQKFSPSTLLKPLPFSVAIRDCADFSLPNKADQRLNQLCLGDESGGRLECFNIVAFEV